MGSQASAAGPGPWPPSRLDEWAKAGVFERLQALLLDELGEAGRIDLERKVHGDKAYDHRRCRAYLRHRGIRPRIARRMIESSTRLGRHRWTIERTGPGWAASGGCASAMSETPDASMLWRCWPVR
jgi:hypothetical protein